MKKILLIVLLLKITAINTYAQDYNPAKYNLAQVTLSADEQKLYSLIMEYRKQMGLPSIPLSRSLTYVAQVHCWDVSINQPVTDECNMHSWSSKGKWSGCCYTEDHAQAKCMWNKPKELTQYSGYGFEISYGTSGYKVTPQGALEGWQKSNGHNAVIINADIWSDSQWKAIGIGIYGGYAMVWFGEESDPAEPLR